MMKVLYIFFLLTGGFVVKAQNLDEIKMQVALTQYDKAKEAIDKFLSNEKNAKKAEGWYYKSHIYNYLARVENKPVAEKKALNDAAFEALKKYNELDPKLSLTKEEQNTTLFNIYYGYYDMAIKSYNAKSYEDSYNQFKNALEIHDYIFANKVEGPQGMKFSEHDTDIVWNLVILGNELKKNDEVISYQQRIARADLSDDKYIGVYENLVNYYRGKDPVLFKEYLEKAKKFYPKEQYWEAVDIENQIAGLEKDDLFKKYEELTAAYPQSYMLFFNYAIDLNKYVYSDATKGQNTEAYKAKIPELLKKAISINSTPDANMVLANFYYNNYYDLSENARITKDVKKKNELNAAAKNNMNLCLPVAEEAVRLFATMKELKSGAKANYKLALEMLTVGYKLNGNTKKAEEYEKQRSELEKG